ncbi:unnamed protein product, partial [Brenthis ino]
MPGAAAAPGSYRRRPTPIRIPVESYITRHITERRQQILVKRHGTDFSDLKPYTVIAKYIYTIVSLGYYKEMRRAARGLCDTFRARGAGSEGADVARRALLIAAAAYCAH